MSVLNTLAAVGGVRDVELDLLDRFAEGGLDPLEVDRLAAPATLCTLVNTHALNSVYMEKEPVFAVILDAPVPSEQLHEIAVSLSRATGGDVAKIQRRLATGGTLARAKTPGRAEQVAAVLRSAGLQVRVEAPQSEFEWNTEGDGPSQPAVVTYAQPSPAAKTPTNAALAGALVCLVLGGLISYYAPLLLFVFGPLFVAAFALSIVAISQRRVTGGIILLLASLIIGPAMTFGGFARVLAPIVSPPAPTRLPPENSSPNVVGGDMPSRGSTETPAPSGAGTAVAGSTYLPFIDLYDLEARRISTILGDDVVGVRFKLRNTGDRTVKRLHVTVYFRDANDVVVFQDEFTPVTDNQFSRDFDVLRPNHIFQLATDRYLTSDRVPSEWQPGNVIAEVTTIELE